jgi:hypothetical protein
MKVSGSRPTRSIVAPYLTPTRLHVFYPKGDGGLGTQNAEHVDREGSLECVGTLKNWNSSPQQLTIMCKYLLDLLAEDVMLQLVLLVKYKLLLEKCRFSVAKIPVAEWQSFW